MTDAGNLPIFSTWVLSVRQQHKTTDYQGKPDNHEKRLLVHFADGRRWVTLATAFTALPLGPRVEVEDDRATAQRRQAKELAVLVGQLEVRCWGAWADHGRHDRTCVASNEVSPAR